jgi:hypothetical protein
MKRSGSGREGLVVVGFAVVVAIFEVVVVEIWLGRRVLVVGLVV